MAIISPCKDCQNRKEYCHDVCQTYITWKGWQTAIKTALKQDKDWDAVVSQLHRKRGGK